METLLLHSFRRCPFAIRVRMCLEEKGLFFSVIEEDLSAPSERLLSIHPEGKVPVLVHRGLVIPESAVITEYLEEVFPTPALMPATPALRAEVRGWTAWCHETFKPDLDGYKYPADASLTVAGEASLSPASTPIPLSERVERLHAHLGKLERALGEKPYLLGLELTLADIHLFPFYRQLTRVRPELPGLSGFPRLNAWLERITARPSFERVMQKK